MKKQSKTNTKTSGGKKSAQKVVSGRKNTSASTRSEGRQRSGNNGPQQGSH